MDLNSLFLIAVSKYKNDQIPSLEVLKEFQKCAKIATDLDMFSNNEILEDINTADLKYLLLDAYLSEITTNLPFEDTLERLKQLKNAQYYSNLFMTRMCFLNMCDYESNSVYNPTEVVYNAIDIRAEKIKRFKQEKEIESKIQELEQLLSVDESFRDEELERDLIIATLELYIFKSKDHQLQLNQELQMLERILEMENTENDFETRVERMTLDTIKKTGPLLSKTGKPLRPFVITTKEDLRKQVFRPGHNLPTMSIEEYLDLEMKRGNFLSGGTEADVTKKAREQEQMEDDVEVVDAATYKARKWDEFTESNPKGWGNRHNKG